MATHPPLPHPALGLRDVVVRHGTRVALTVPELTVEAGEVLTLIGPNGAGKSTLLQVAALLRRPDAGDVCIGGKRATRRAALTLRRRIAMVFQDPLLFDVGVLANVTAGLRFRGIGRAEAERRATDWLARFRVGHLGDRNARSLSGGEAQRVSLARAFAVDPELLLLDEPFAALDAPTRAALVPELAARLREARTAAVIVTHDQAEAVALGDRLGVVLGGRIAQLGPPAEVVARPATVEVAAFLGVENVLPVRVVAVARDRVRVALEPHGQEIGISAPSGAPPDPGPPAALAIRAARVEVRPRDAPFPDGWSAFPGVVTDVVWTPVGQRVAIDCGLRLLASAVQDGTEGPFAAGQAVCVGIAPDAGHLILGTPAD